MSREIKFRAWDKKTKSMIPVDKLEFYLKGVTYDVVNTDGRRYRNETAEIMQYTGLKDKNGKEIYEGDLVTGDRNGTLDEVIFNSGCFCLKNAMLYYEATYWGDEIEVKGNIYENPELVK